MLCFPCVLSAQLPVPSCLGQAKLKETLSVWAELALGLKVYWCAEGGTVAFLEAPVFLLEGKPWGQKTVGDMACLPSDFPAQSQATRNTKSAELEKLQLTRCVCVRERG